MDKYLVPVQSLGTTKRRRLAIGKQRTLESLEKVIVLDRGTTAGNPSEESLRAANSILLREESSEAELLDALRRLSSYSMVSVEILRLTGVGASVRLLKKHQSKDVSRVAQNLTEKWKRLLLGGKSIKAPKVTFTANDNRQQ